MKMAWEIFKRDLRRLGKSPAALVVAAGLCIIPALYAWFNIAANRDPYGSTQNIRVAVVNEDKGAENKNRSLNAGQEILDELEDNEDLGWVFTDAEEALEGVKSGSYYAALVIPENFSEELLTIEDGTAGIPEIQYYVNEKKNAVAPKITDSGATAVQEKIKERFYEEASRVVTQELKDFGGEVSEDLETANDEILSMLSDVRENFEDYRQVLADFEGTIGQGSAQLQHAKGTLGEAAAAAEAGSGAFSDAKDLLSSSRKNVRSFGAAFDQSLSDGEKYLTDIYTAASLKLNGLETMAGQAEQLLTASGQYANKLDKDSKEALLGLQSAVDTLTPALSAKLAELSANLQGYQAQLEQVNAGLALAPDDPELLENKAKLEYAVSQTQAGIETIQTSMESAAQLESGLETLNGENTRLSETLSDLSAGSGKLTGLLNTMNTAKGQMETLWNQGAGTLRDFRGSLNGSLIPGIGTSLDTISDVSSDLETVLSDASATAAQLQDVLDQLDTSLTEGSRALSETGESLAVLDERLAGMQSDLEVLRASDAYQDILDLEKVNPEEVSDFMSSPVKLTSKTFYEVEDYGSGMTPFYTNLALWVGGMVLAAILKLEVDEDERVRGFTPTQAYFGRGLIFVLLSLVQTLIVCLGDLFYLKVQCRHPVLFVLAGLLASFVYLNLIYAITAAFKHIGRAVFVFLVILQIPGSTGTFPVEMMGGFYRGVSRFLPFTYSNRAMREAVGGLYGSTYLKNMGILAAFLLAAWFIGLVLRPALLNLNAFFDRRLSEADFILCEENGQVREEYPPELLAAALRRAPKIREEFRKNAECFEKRYQRRRRLGFLMMAVVPAVFLALMFGMESKLVFLSLWITALIGLSLWLVWLEYEHERRKRQLYLDGLSEEELWKALKGSKERETEAEA